MAKLIYFKITESSVHPDFNSERGQERQQARGSLPRFDENDGDSYGSIASMCCCLRHEMLISFANQDSSRGC